MAPATRPRIRLLIGETTALGPGKAALLEAIADTGSISAAARRMRMSYRRAWNLVQAMNADFVGPLVTPEAGGRGGGGARVTDLGRAALSRYRAMEDQAQEAIAEALGDFAPLLRDPSDPPESR